jgi:hypothetical protein
MGSDDLPLLDTFEQSKSQMRLDVESDNLQVPKNIDGSEAEQPLTDVLISFGSSRVRKRLVFVLIVN